MFDNSFDDQCTQDIKPNWWSWILVESGLFCIHRCFGVRYTVFDIEVISLICS